MSRFVVSVSRHISASPQALFDVVATPAMHPKMDGKATVQAARVGNPKRLELGSTFGMHMKLGARYRTKSEVIEFDEPSRIAWRVGGRGAVWRYVFEPDGGGTRVTEQWDVSTMPARWALLAAGFAGRSRRGMAATLERLPGLVTR